MKADPLTRQRARTLRRDLTDAERILWSRLKGRQVNGWQFRNQHPVGPYILDFACVRARIALEVDGSSHTDDRQIAHDASRAAYLRRLGWSVHRFWNADIYRNLNAVMDGIFALMPPPTQR